MTYSVTSDGAAVPAHVEEGLAVNRLGAVAVHVLCDTEGDVRHVEDRREPGTQTSTQRRSGPMKRSKSMLNLRFSKVSNGTFPAWDAMPLKPSCSEGLADVRWQRRRHRLGEGGPVQMRRSAALGAELSCIRWRPVPSRPRSQHGFDPLELLPARLNTNGGRTLRGQGGRTMGGSGAVPRSAPGYRESSA